MYIGFIYNNTMGIIKVVTTYIFQFVHRNEYVWKIIHMNEKMSFNLHLIKNHKISNYFSYK